MKLFRQLQKVQTRCCTAGRARPATDPERAHPCAEKSRSHLRAFGSLLKGYGVEYRAQFISEEYLEEILASDRETGVYDEDGEVLSACGRQGRSRW